MEIFENLDPLLKAFWYIAIPSSLIFIVQTIMTFIGADGSDGIDADFDSNLDGTDAPFQLFSLRNLINFLLGFSWTGISFYSTISNPTVLILVSLFVGLLFLFLFFAIIKQIKKLEEDNSFKISDTVDKRADVYLTIPGNRSGKGKVTMSIKGSYRELDAMTDSDRIESGAVVVVERVEKDSILIVKPI